MKTELSPETELSANLSGGAAPSSSTTPQPETHPQVEAIARSAVQLAALGPELATLAAKMEDQAKQQAHHAEQVASATRTLAETLGAVVTRLEGASSKVQDVIGEIQRIADQTRILSINASIEAARAGEQGRAFGVVAGEVQRLADQTRGCTGLIEERVDAIQHSVHAVSAAVATRNDGPTADAAGAELVTVQSVNTQVQKMAGTAESQRTGARSLRALGDHANRQTEELLLAVGAFRLEGHRQAEQAVRDLLPRLARQAGRTELEQVLEEWLVEHAAFELLYVTTAQGRQLTGNIGWKAGKTWVDRSPQGMDWSDRAWFIEARQAPGGLAITDIYRSKATGDFCFTVSAVVRTVRGDVLGVLGADVNFQKLVGGQVAAATDA